MVRWFKIANAEDYYLIVDNREQVPLTWKKNVKKGTLNVGDYGCEYDGRLLNIVFERKSPQDLMSSITSGHERFKREWLRAKEQGIRLIIVVECNYETFVEKKFSTGYRSKINPQILQRILHKSIVRHNLEIIFFNNREVMQKFIRLMFNALVEEAMNEKIKSTIKKKE